MAPKTSPILSPRRRVLANKTTNASLSVLTSPSRKRGTETYDESHGPQKLKAKGSVPTVTAGQKRTISQVEDLVQQPSPRHAQTPEEMDSNKESKVAKAVNVSTLSKSSSNHPAYSSTTSFHASQEPEAELEPSFDIPEEVLRDSQVEKLNATHIPHDDLAQKEQVSSQSSSSPSRQSDRSLRITAPGDSQESLHMSSFLDFSQNDADDKSTKITPPSAKSAKEVQQTTIETEARRKFMAEKAALLRTNLQLAYHKIQTGQTTTPFRKLKSPPKQLPLTAFTQDARRSPEPSLPAFPSFPAPRISQARETALRTERALSPESRISSARASATAQPKPTSKPLSAIPKPSLLPTAYSARWADKEKHLRNTSSHPQPTPPITQPELERGDKRVEEQDQEINALPETQLPSSPPPSNREASDLSVRLDEKHQSGRSATPTPGSPAKRKTAGKSAQTLPSVPVQLSSPPGSCEGSPPPLPSHRRRLGRVVADCSRVEAIDQATKERKDEGNGVVQREASINIGSKS